MVNKAPILKNPQLTQADINQLNEFLRSVERSLGAATIATTPTIVTPTPTPITATPTIPIGVIIQEVPFSGNTGYYAFASTIPHVLKLTGANTVAATLTLVSTSPLLFALNNQTTGGQVITVSMGTTSIVLEVHAGVTWCYFDGSTNIILSAPNSDISFAPKRDIIPSGSTYQIDTGEQVIIAEQLQVDGSVNIDGGLFIW